MLHLGLGASILSFHQSQAPVVCCSGPLSPTAANQHLVWLGCTQTQQCAACRFAYFTPLLMHLPSFPLIPSPTRPISGYGRGNWSVRPMFHQNGKADDAGRERRLASDLGSAYDPESVPRGALLHAASICLPSCRQSTHKVTKWLRESSDMEAWRC